MAFLTIEKKIRIGQEQQKMLEELLQKDGNFESESHVIRCAINHFYRVKIMGLK